MDIDGCMASSWLDLGDELRLQPLTGKCGVVQPTPTIKVFLAFYIMARSTILTCVLDHAVVLVTTWQHSDGQNHCCYRATPSQYSN